MRVAPGQGVPPKRAQIRRTPPTSGVALVGYIFQDEAASGQAQLPPAGDVPPNGAAVSPETDEQQRHSSCGVGMDVEIETLPDLDVVILRGRDRDVEELARIIEELERLRPKLSPRSKSIRCGMCAAALGKDHYSDQPGTGAQPTGTSQCHCAWKSRIPCC